MDVPYQSNNAAAPIGDQLAIQNNQTPNFPNQGFGYSGNNNPINQEQQFYIKPVQQIESPQQFQPVQPVQPAQPFQTAQPVQLNQPQQSAYSQIPQTMRDQNQVVVLVNPINQAFIANPPRHSFSTVCPNCNKVVNTEVEFENNGYVWLVCLLLFCFTAFFCCIAFCINSLKDVSHRCPICKNVIASRKA